MRRPLCLIGLAFVAALLSGILVIPHEAKPCDALDGERLAVAGRVGWKERRISDTEEILVVTLEEVLVPKPENTAALKQIISNSDAIRPNHISADSAKKTEKYLKHNRERFMREDTEKIRGILCYLDGEEEPAMGSIVLMEGKFFAFSHASNPGEYDAANYYRIMGQQGRLTKSVCLSESPGFWPFREKLYGLKEYLALLLNASFPGKEAAVMRAMLLGEKGVLDADIKSLYQQNGIIHILSISGLHLSVLGMGVYEILKRLHIPVSVNIILSIGLMCCYGTMTGMGISVVRALVMFGLKLCAGLFGRTYDMPTAMVAAAMLILLKQPMYLTHSGFLFSFGAVCGIGLLPSVQEYLPDGNRPMKALFTGLWISLTTLPVYLCFYFEFPPYSVLLNLLVIPCMGLVLAGGLFSMFAAAVFLPFGKAAAVPVVFILTVYEKCCNLCLSLPGSRWITGCPSSVQVVFYLAVLVGTALFCRRVKRWQFWGLVLCAVLFLTVRLPSGFEITMLDIGQGDCIYVADQRGGHYLIDGGSSDQKEVEKYRIAPFLKYRGVGRLDGVFVTHPDEDHISGINGLLEDCGEGGIEIGSLFLPDIDSGSRDGRYFRLEELAREAGVTVGYLHAGDKICVGEVMLTCLHPPEGYICGDANTYSTTLYLQYGTFSALFTGDLEGDGEKLLTDRYRRMAGLGAVPEKGVVLLKVAHHGSKNSTGEELLSLLQPKIALISAGRDNSYGHPHRETLERLENRGCLVYQTSVSGAVTIRVRSGRVLVEEYR